jgi:arylsulfatase A-like enzyme
VYSIAGYYGTHGYDSELPSMSAIFYAAGPSFARATLDRVHNIDVAPTVLAILGVPPAPTVDGAVLRAALRAPRP